MNKGIIIRKLTVYVVAVLCLLTPIAALADGYTYNSYGKTVSVPDIYSPVKKYSGSAMGCGELSNPADFCADENGVLYIADKGNNRIVIFDAESGDARTLESFSVGGETVSLLNPGGVFVADSNKIYIADTDNERILLSDSTGNVQCVFSKPDISQFKQDLFLPVSVIADSYGNVYAKCTGIYQGLVMFDKNGRYLSFFGSETVKATAAIQLQYWWKSLMNDEQKSQISRYVPTEIKGIDIDTQGYIYTVAASQGTNGVKDTMDNIRRLNTLGNDILVNKMNKSAWKTFESDAREMNFVDICVDRNNFTVLVDNRQGLIILLDDRMQILDILGGYGDSTGKYLLPCAAERYENKLYILDSTACAVTVYEQTEYGKSLEEALLLYNKGYYAETVEAWNGIIKNNTNCEIAYDGLGNAYLSQNDYKNAIKCFKIARNSEGYNEAFKYIRKQYIKKYFTPVLCCCLAVIGGIVIFSRRKRGKTDDKA